MPDAGDAIQFRADRGDARLTLDEVLVRRITELSRVTRDVARIWIVSGDVAVNGIEVTSPSHRVAAGATVRLHVRPDAVRRVTPAPEQMNLETVFEDSDFLVVAKPPDMVVHPTYKQLTGTLLNGVLWHVRDRPHVRPGILTRLDRNTSGLVIVALHPQIHAAMQRDAAAGRVVKEYLAVVDAAPDPPAGTIVLPLARDSADRRRVVVAPGGAACETRYETLAVQEHGAAGSQGRQGALVLCRLITGRTHQIRVHLAGMGWPVTGDVTYGRSDSRIGRQALHAWRLSFPHPVARTSLTLSAAVPPDMAALLPQNFTL